MSTDCGDGAALPVVTAPFLLFCPPGGRPLLLTWDTIRITGTDITGRRFVDLMGVVGGFASGGSCVKIWPVEPGDPQTADCYTNGRDGKVWFAADRVEHITVLDREAADEVFD